MKNFLVTYNCERGMSSGEGWTDTDEVCKETIEEVRKDALARIQKAVDGSAWGTTDIWNVYIVEVVDEAEISSAEISGIIAEKKLEIEKEKERLKIEEKERQRKAEEQREYNTYLRLKEKFG